MQTLHIIFAALLSLSLVFSSPLDSRTEPVCKTITFEERAADPIVNLQPVGTIRDIKFEGFVLASIAVPGTQIPLGFSPNTPPIVAGGSLRTKATTGDNELRMTVFNCPECQYPTFNLKQLYLNCGAAIGIGAVVISVPCRIRVQGLDRDGKQVKAVDAEFKPDPLIPAVPIPGNAKQKPTQINFTGFDNLETVVFSLIYTGVPVGSDALTGVGIDTVEVCFPQ